MDYFTFQITANTDTRFSNWNYLEKHVKETISKAGILPQWQSTLSSIKKIELTIKNNSMSSTYDLENGVLTKMHRVPDADLVAEIYNAFIQNNGNELNEIKKLGVTFSSAIIDKNVQLDQDKVKTTLEQLPKFTGNSVSLLRNLIPLHVEHTDYGILYIRQDYIEVWFNTGHIDFIRNLSYDLYENIYYKIYKEDHLIDSNIIRFAFPRSYDYEPAPHYISLGCPDGTCGTSCANDIINSKVDTEYLRLYIDQMVEVINKWKTITDLFPDDPVRLENRVQDHTGYYFMFLGTNRNLTLTEFVDLQVEYLLQLIDFLNNPTIDKNEIVSYFRDQLI